MKVKEGEMIKESFVPKTITFTIESEKELAVLYLRLNCPLVSITDGFASEFDIGKGREGMMDKIDLADESILPLINMIVTLLPTTHGYYPRWAKEVLLKED